MRFYRTAACRVCFILLVWTSMPGMQRPAAAQADGKPVFGWESEARVLGANLLLGGVSAGLAALVRGEPVLEGFAHGAGGGALVYAGKRIAAEPGPATGFVGRQVASVGGSIVGNAVAGRGSLDRIAFGLGPFRLSVRRQASPALRLRIDPVSVAAIGWIFMRGGRLDAAKSLSTGAVVLDSGEEFALPGVISFDAGADSERQAYVIDHESVHILQYDQSYLFWGEPVEGWLEAAIPGIEGPLKHIEFNVPILTVAAALGISTWRRWGNRQPWEREAIYLGRTGR